jgi:hypothetical protein
MAKSKTQFLLNAAIAGIIGASVFGLGNANANHHETKGNGKGHCVGANACKGKGGCAQKGKNECKGKNGCKGKGFMSMTKAECEKVKGAKYEPSKM